MPQSYSIKAAAIPSYSTVLNNTGSSDKSGNLYMNSPVPFIPHSTEKNDYPRSMTLNGADTSKIYQNNENFYTNQPPEKFDTMYRYDDKNFYSNIGNLPGPQVPITSDRSDRSTRNAVYSNIEPAIPIPVPKPIQKEKDIIYSNIQWNSSKPENTYCNIPAPGHNNGENLTIFNNTFQQFFRILHSSF